MANKLKNELLGAFTGKMENRQAFIMQFVMNIVQKGNPPPKKEDLDKIVSELIQEGIFEEKGDLLILKKKQSAPLEEKIDEIPEKSPIKNSEKLSPIQIQVLEAFQGSFENKSALLMNVTMNEASKGRAPPSKDELETAINGLLQDGVLESKESMLIKKK
ncbi:MAG: hypothetical protein ACXAC6_08795 [Candidatus Hodarchaeales archaeon]|jgi:predicted transcriptional regulator YheO